MNGVPPWVGILDAAGGDPLRAQDMEANLSQYWWERYQVYTHEKNRAAEEEAKRLKEQWRA